MPNNERMREIILDNPELEEILNEFVENFFEDDMSFIDKYVKDRKHENFHATSEEYRHDIQSRPHEGYPMNAKLIGPTKGEWGGGEGKLAEAKRNIMKDTQRKLNEFTGANFNALCAYYPSDGYIGWHTNQNCPGYNILFVYNTTDDGYFRYQDPVTKEIHTLYDKGGKWNIRVGYYGGHDEEDDILWHCAETKSPRVNIAFVINQEEMWMDMIDEIEGD